MKSSDLSLYSHSLFARYERFRQIRLPMKCKMPDIVGPASLIWRELTLFILAFALPAMQAWIKSTLRLDSP